MQKKEKQDVFFQVARESIKTSEGVVDLPILYFDVNVMIVFYFIDPEKANELLKDTDLEAVRFYNQKSLVALALFEYKDTTVGIYNEIGIGIASKIKETEIKIPMWEIAKLLFHKNPEEISLGFYVVHLPVTTKKANAAGREIWGYPKFVTNIKLDFNFAQKKFNGILLDPKSKKPIFEMQTNLNKSLISIPAFDLLTYTYLNHNLIRTHVNVSGNFYFSFTKECRLTNVIANHPMAYTIKELGLNNHDSYLVLYSNNWQSRLNKGEIFLESKKNKEEKKQKPQKNSTTSRKVAKAKK